MYTRNIILNWWCTFSLILPFFYVFQRKFHFLTIIVSFFCIFKKDIINSWFSFSEEFLYFEKSEPQFNYFKTNTWLFSFSFFFCVFHTICGSYNEDLHNGIYFNIIFLLSLQNLTITKIIFYCNLLHNNKWSYFVSFWKNQKTYVRKFFFPQKYSANCNNDFMIF